jgi:hypothetical protein
MIDPRIVKIMTCLAPAGIGCYEATFT